MQGRRSLILIASIAAILVLNSATAANDDDLGGLISDDFADAERMSPMDALDAMRTSEEDEQQSTMAKRNRAQDQVKKSETVLRFGKRNRGGSDAVLRFGRANGGGQAPRVEPMRFGRGGSSNTLLRFGRARPADSVLRFGRARPADTTLRFG